MTFLNYVLTIIFLFSFLLAFLKGVLEQRRKMKMLETKVQYLFEKTGVSDDPVLVLTPAIRKAVADGKTIEAIKLYREAIGGSLKKAKAAVEKIASPD